MKILTRVLLVLALCATVFAADVPIDGRDQFNAAYWLAQPAAVRALKDLPAGGARVQAALDLAKAGYAVDVMIEAYGFEPWGTMASRKLQGFAWAPAILQDYQLTQYAIAPWYTSPDTPMPKGAIKTSLDLADYPAFDPPPPPPTVTLVANPVGSNIWGTSWGSNFGDNWPVGSTYTDTRGTFTKVSQASAFGTRSWWEKK